MEYAEVVRRRRMVRNYDPDRPVSPEIIRTLLEYAIHAPSAGFSQGWHFLVLTAADERVAFWGATAADKTDSWLAGMQNAPLLIVAFSDKETYLDRYAEDDKGWTDRSEEHWPVPYWDIDTGMAALLIMLGAVDEGLVSCFFGVPPERVTALRAAFDVPDRLRPVGVVSLGYRAATDLKSPSLRRGRRGLETVVSAGRFGVPLPAE
jgi:nitroreductase